MHAKSIDAPGGAMSWSFKFMVGAAALFIAGCSAFFSVKGLGLLFIGSATAVMVMAASLELGKLIAASFLYRYWSQITPALRFYLTAAVLLLIAITSLGNYGYLARAYEQTNSQIAVLEQQIQSVQQEIDDTQKQIDASRQRLGKVSDEGRQDIAAVQQRMAAAEQALEQTLLRLDERRKTARERRQRDVELQNARLAEVTTVLKRSLDSTETQVTALNERVSVLDRAVDAYTREGGGGFMRSDSIRKGQELRVAQQPERDAITAEIAEHRKRQAELRAEHQKAVELIHREIAALDDQYKRDSAALNAEEQAARKSRQEALAAAEKQLDGLRSQGQALSAAGGGQVEGLYQRIRTGNDEMRRLREQVAATDIGSYRFVARAFNAPADDVVKWLMLVLVLVFDPLAVALTVGFNVALLRDRRGRPAPACDSAIPAAAQDAAGSVTSGGLGLLGRRLATAGLALLVLGLAGGGAYLGWNALRQRERSSHAAQVPPDSFAVLTIRPAQLRSESSDQKLRPLLNSAIGAAMAQQLEEAVQTGFDPAADIYAFAKYPRGAAPATADRPVMLLGLVARITDTAAAEAALSKFANALTSSLAQGAGSGETLTRSRLMVRYGTGRYLDPRGGFFSFALTDQQALVLLEIEGDPTRPTVEAEIRQCLASPDEAAKSYGAAPPKLPRRATESGGALSLWFDAGRCFAQMPKNASAQTRYQQLQKHLGFDLLLQVQPAQQGLLNLVGEYSYSAQRFGGNEPTVVQVLDKLGPVDAAGIPGRLMDRCAVTLDYDSLIEQLKVGLGGSGRASQVLVEKTIGSAREGKFVLTARYEPQAGPPLVAALRSLAQ